MYLAMQSITWCYFRASLALLKSFVCQAVVASARAVCKTNGFLCWHGMSASGWYYQPVVRSVNCDSDEPFVHCANSFMVGAVALLSSCSILSWYRGVLIQSVKQQHCETVLSKGKSVSDITGRSSMWSWRKHFLAYSSRFHSALLIGKWNGDALIWTRKFAASVCLFEKTGWKFSWTPNQKITLKDMLAD